MKKWFESIISCFKPKTKEQKSKKQYGSSFFSFQHTGEVIKAENLLRQAGFRVEVKGPPPYMRTGCDMVLVCESIAEPVISRILNDANLPPEQVLPVGEGLMEPVSLYQVTDLGDWLMVRAANMKITITKQDGTIVNVSGGGCPDVPYLAAKILGENIVTCEEPRISGQTLCSYSLQKAFMEARRWWLQEHG